MGKLISGVASTGLSFASAKLQADAEKDKLKLQKEVFAEQKKFAHLYHDLWNNHYRPLELSFLDYWAKKKPYEPQYQATQARITVAVRDEFARAKEKLRRCVDWRCFGYICESLKSLSLAEARSAVEALNKGYRAEEARKEIKDKEWQDGLFAMLQLGRGLIPYAMNALNGASSSAQATQLLNPNQGYANALGALAGTIEKWNAEKQYGTEATGFGRTVQPYNPFRQGRGFNTNIYD